MAADEPGATLDRQVTIVGIGASAGGLEPLLALAGRLKPDRMAYVVLQHLAPASDNLLRDLLAKATSLKVVTAADGDRVECNVIYVAPPANEVVVIDGALRVTPLLPRMPHLPIDTLFRSLAAQLGPDAVGVILSGAGADGTLGMQAIRDQGGITLAQQPGTASQPSMPQSAIDVGAVDLCLSPDEIGDELVRLSAHALVARKRPQRLFEQSVLAKIFDKLRSPFGVDFSTYKLTTIERRIERRMAVHKLDRLDDYLKFLDSSPHELKMLYSDLLIGVTGFFRDREPFEALKTVVFPRVADKHAVDVPLRIWCAGCSTGEEPYSIAMAYLEYLDGRPPGAKVQIFATDIDDQALERARQGIYPAGVALDLAPQRLQRFFAKHEKGYQISRQIRDMVVFAHHNLGKDPPFSRIDLISCRNVLIYMQPALQKKILRLFHYALQGDGVLLLGSSETVGDSDLFSTLDLKTKLFSRKHVASAAVFDFAAPPQVSGRAPNLAPSAPDHRPSVTVQQLADRKVIEKYAPPGVLLDENLDVVQFRGQTGPFLAPSPGLATLNVLKLVRPELLVALRSVVQRSEPENYPISSEPVPLSSGALVVLDAMPVQEPGNQRRCQLVLFRELPRADAPPTPTRADLPVEPRIEELERELITTKEYLQTSVADLEASNEELQSSNEELLSANEELQSTNEELQTSKEELQSTNEELSTVNEELENRMAQLSVSNDDLQNVMAGTQAVLLIVGTDLRLRRFSATAAKLLNLIPGDVGRPVAHLATMFNAPIDSAISEVISSNRPRELRVKVADGHAYTMRALPYRTEENAIRGAIIELTRAPVARGPSQPPEIQEFVGKVLSTLPHVLMLLDDQLRLVWVNKAFFDTFGVGAEVLGQPLEEVWNARETYPKLFELLDQTAAGGPAFLGHHVEHPFGRKSERAMKFGAHFIAPEGDRSALALVVMEEEA